jgi:putative ABC transport system ATP-binding protein
MGSILSLTGITKSYLVGHRSLSILKGIDLNIERGEYVAIMGASGSGKSTLLHIMGGLDRPTTGSVVINNQNLETCDDARLARIRNQTIGFVFQNFMLLNYYSALENVCLPLIYAKKKQEGRLRAMTLLKLFGMGRRLNHRPNELSGGEKQRVAIARALVNKPSIIFADEPTGALDTKTGDAILATLDVVHQAGTTVVLITHDPRVAKRASRTLHIADGMLVAA